mgnify:CR=1 FL=1
MVPIEGGRVPARTPKSLPNKSDDVCQFVLCMFVLLATHHLLYCHRKPWRHGHHQQTESDLCSLVRTDLFSNKQIYSTSRLSLGCLHKIARGMGSASRGSEREIALLLTRDTRPTSSYLVPRHHMTPSPKAPITCRHSGCHLLHSIAFAECESPGP